MNLRATGLLAVLVAAALALVVAGCGGGGSSSSSEPAASEGSNGGSSESEAAGKSEGGGSGGINVEKKKIGAIDIAGASSPISMASLETIELGCEALGWECIVDEGEANPEVMARDVNAYATQGVDAVLMGSIEPQVVQAGLNRLHENEDPVIGYNAQVTPSPLLTAQFTENEETLARTLAEYIVEEEPAAKIGDITSTLGISGTNREKAMQEVVQKSAEAEVVASVEPNFESLVPSTTKGVTDMLTAHPEINTIWSVYDNFLQPTIAALRSKGSKARLYTFYLDPISYELLSKESSLEAVCSVNLAKTAAVALDQLVQHFQTGKPINPKAMEESPLTYEIINRENLPKSQKEANDPEEIIAPFIAKWEKEYGG